MKFKSLVTTSDGKLTKDKIYSGSIGIIESELRIIVLDDHGRWTTFNPSAFIHTETSFSSEQIGAIAGGTAGEIAKELRQYREAFKNEQHKFGIEFLKNEKLQLKLDIAMQGLGKIIDKYFSLSEEDRLQKGLKENESSLIARNTLMQIQGVK